MDSYVDYQTFYKRAVGHQPDPPAFTRRAPAPLPPLQVEERERDDGDTWSDSDALGFDGLAAATLRDIVDAVFNFAEEFARAVRDDERLLRDVRRCAEECLVNERLAKAHVLATVLEGER